MLKQVLIVISLCALPTFLQLVEVATLHSTWTVICKPYLCFSVTYVFILQYIQDLIFFVGSMQRLNGSSSVSETYGNPCLAHSEDFEVKEVEVCMEPFPFSFSLSHTRTHTHSTQSTVVHQLHRVKCLLSWLQDNRQKSLSFPFLAAMGLCTWFKVWGNTCFKQNRGSWDLSVLNVKEQDRAQFTMTWIKWFLWYYWMMLNANLLYISYGSGYMWRWHLLSTFVHRCSTFRRGVFLYDITIQFWMEAGFDSNAGWSYDKKNAHAAVHIHTQWYCQELYV